MLKYLFPMMAIFLVACESDNVFLGPVKWEGADIEVETRPSPPTTGMVEFILIASRNKSRPVTDMVISFRTSDKYPWRQAIQDGFSGVYRRAVRVGDVSTAVLQVKIHKKDNTDAILRFPLRQVTGGKKA